MPSNEPPSETDGTTADYIGHSARTSGGATVYRSPDFIVLEDGKGQTFRLRTGRAGDPAWLLAWIRRLARRASIDRLTIARIIDVAENGAGLKLPDKSRR